MLLLSKMSAVLVIACGVILTSGNAAASGFTGEASFRSNTITTPVTSEILEVYVGEPDYTGNGEVHFQVIIENRSVTVVPVSLSLTGENLKTFDLGPGEVRNVEFAFNASYSEAEILELVGFQKYIHETYELKFDPELINGSSAEKETGTETEESTSSDVKSDEEDHESNDQVENHNEPEEESLTDDTDIEKNMENKPQEKKNPKDKNDKKDKNMPDEKSKDSESVNDKETDNETDKGNDEDKKGGEENEDTKDEKKLNKEENKEKKKEGKKEKKDEDIIEAAAE
ncbi:hypothetical protein [Salipaludibacillus aurantiacus]|uniref:Uncharacterized protein n=1 Tax=Salipaludibacillus aurantiacus TaxID=1601833 RepID=A0A1H9UEW7_9BACI|nr:hypothetical protein [Salipaludibacillus aurantiacus]SES07603.1 hypothetical protein SAMN05518684_107153 [Salipaludibacillus aurantiacus]